MAHIVFQNELKGGSPEFKLAFPEAGEDVKAMGYRRKRELTLTIALALVDRHVPSAGVYFELKQAIQAALETYAR